MCPACPAGEGPGRRCAPSGSVAIFADADGNVIGLSRKPTDRPSCSPAKPLLV